MSLQQTMKSTAFALATLGAGVSAESHLQKAMFRGGAPDRDLSAILAGDKKGGNVTNGGASGGAGADGDADGKTNFSAEMLAKLEKDIAYCASLESNMPPADLVDADGNEYGLTAGGDDTKPEDCINKKDGKPCCVKFKKQDVDDYVARVAATNKEHNCKDDEMWVEDENLCKSTDLVLKSMGIDSEDFFGADGDLENGDGSTGDDMSEGDKQSEEKESKDKKKMSVEWVLPAFAAGALALLAVFGLFVHRRRSSGAVVEDGSAAASPSKKAEKQDEKVAKNEDKKRLASVTSSGLNGGGASSKKSSGRKIYGGRSPSSSPRSMGASDKKKEAEFEARMEVV